MYLLFSQFWCALITIVIWFCILSCYLGCFQRKLLGKVVALALVYYKWGIFFFVLTLSLQAFVFSGQCRSRSDCREPAVWSLIYTVHIFNLDYITTVSSSCNGPVFLANEKIQFIYSVVKNLTYLSLFWMLSITLAWSLLCIKPELQLKKCREIGKGKISRIANQILCCG